MMLDDRYGYISNDITRYFLILTLMDIMWLMSHHTSIYLHRNEIYSLSFLCDV